MTWNNAVLLSLHFFHFLLGFKYLFVWMDRSILKFSCFLRITKVINWPWIKVE